MTVMIIMSSDIVAVENSTAPSTIAPLQTVDVQAASNFMANYQELVDALLDENDYQQIGDKNAKKKSAWRKLATAFNISDEPVSKEIIRDECHRIISAHYEVKAILPNGRTAYGVGSCSIWDKITKKDLKEPTPFELRKRFTNAEHDIIGTAHTRAKSRAIADLIGAGEVSAEELDGMVSSKGPKVKPKTKSKTARTSTMGNKPKAPKKKAPSKPKIDDDAIEVEAKSVETHDMSAKTSLKDIIDSDMNIRLAVDELQAQDRTVNRDSIREKLLDLLEMGTVKTADYDKAVKLLE